VSYRDIEKLLETQSKEISRLEKGYGMYRIGFYIALGVSAAAVGAVVILAAVN
jgi:hypothetical protein